MYLQCSKKKAAKKKRQKKAEYCKFIVFLL